VSERLFIPEDVCEDSKCEHKRGHSGYHRGVLAGMRATWETYQGPFAAHPTTPEESTDEN
jgi:hypothetical protein